MINRNIFYIPIIFALVFPLHTWSEQINTDSTSKSFEHAPPAKHETIPVNPSPDTHTWVKGYWNWKNNKWAWNNGKYAVVINERPPIRNHERRSFPPSQQHSWIPGNWVGNDDEWSWSNGYYVKKPFINAFWKSGRWEYRGIGWIWIPGHW